MLDRIKPMVAPQLANPAEVGSDSVKSVLGGGDAFRTILFDSIQQVQNFQGSANQAVERFMAGENEDLHQVALATQKAELSLDLFLQVRNKLVQAYQEVMRMQV